MISASKESGSALFALKRGKLLYKMIIQIGEKATTPADNIPNRMLIVKRNKPESVDVHSFIGWARCLLSMCLI